MTAVIHADSASALPSGCQLKELPQTSACRAILSVKADLRSHSPAAHMVPS